MGRSVVMFSGGAMLSCCIGDIIRIAMGARLDETGSIGWISITAFWVVVAMFYRIRLGR